MSDEFSNALTGNRARTSNRTSGSRADDGESSMYNHRGYDPKTGKKWSEQRQRGSGARPSFNDMEGYASQSGSEGNYNRRERQSYKSRFGAGEQHAGAQQDEFEDNQYAGAEASTSADVAPVTNQPTAQDLANFDITNEKGLRQDLAVLFSGAPIQFARGKAPVSADVDASGPPAASEWEARAEDNTGFDPGRCHFEGMPLSKQMRSSQRMGLLADKTARGMADIVAAQRCVVPLAVTVRTAHNPFPFPVGIKSAHDPLNQVTTPSGERFMVLLAPGTHDSNKYIDLRTGIRAGGVCASAAVATEDLASQYKPSGPAAPRMMMVKEDSALYDAIEAFSASGRIDPPVDFAKLPASRSAGGVYRDCVPDDAVHFALEQLRRIKGSNHGKQSIDNMTFTLHPCNFEGRWDGHHLSGAGYDKESNPGLFTDFMHRPENVLVHLELEYL